MIKEKNEQGQIYYKNSWHTEIYYQPSNDSDGVIFIAGQPYYISTAIDIYKGLQDLLFNELKVIKEV